MKILFITQYAAHFHYFKSIIKAALERVDKVEFLLLKGKHNKPEYLEAISAFKNQSRNFDYGWAVTRSTGLWRKILFLARDLSNYRRYLLINMETPHYRERMRKALPFFLTKIANLNFFNGFLKSDVVGKVLKKIENTTSPHPGILEDIKKRSPDVLIATPVNMRRAEEACDLEYLKAAVDLGIPTFVPIVSWDNLTTKGNFHILPDLILAWNERHVSEAKKFHQIPDEKLKIMGAMLFDGWFSDFKPSLNRQDFCRKYGLDPARPYLLYLGSTTNIASDESWIPAKLRELLDSSQDQALKEVQIVIRSHPSNYEIYRKILGKGIWLVPENPKLPDRPDDSQLFYDTVYHALAAIDGVNTSAIIDAVIIGKPGIAIVTNEYSKTQSQTEYFKNLISFGFLAKVSLGRDFLEEIKILLAGKDYRRELRKGFIAEYIRPRGLERSAGTVVMEEIEKFLS